MLYASRTWLPVRDAAGIVHHATQLTKQEAEYLFRLADTVRAVVGCVECGVEQGESCQTKKGLISRNHSIRVAQTRMLFTLRILPKLDRLHQTLCSVGSGPGYVVYNQAEGQNIDCMSCLVDAAK